MDVWKANSQWYLPSATILSKNSKVTPFPVDKVKIAKGKELYQVGFCENVPFVFLTTEGKSGEIKLCVHLGIFDNIGFDVVHKSTHGHVINLSSKKDATIPEIQICLASVDDKNKLEKQLRQIIETLPKDLPMVGHRFGAPSLPKKGDTSVRCSFCHEKTKPKNPIVTCSVCEIAVHAESCMLLSNYFDSCASQFNARSQTPTKESLQKTFKLFQNSMLPVVDVPSLSLFEYIYGRANTLYPMKFEGKIQKEELVSDIYSYNCFDNLLILDDAHPCSLGETSVFHYLMNKIVQSDNRKEIEMGAQILERLAQQENVQELIRTNYLMPLLEVITQDISQVMTVIVSITDKINNNGFKFEPSFLDGCEFNASISDKVTRVVCAGCRNYKFSVTEFNQKILSALIAICNTASEQIDVNKYRPKEFKAKTWVLMSQWKSIVNTVVPVLYSAYLYSSKWTKLIGGSVGLMGIVRAASEGTFRIHNVIRLEDILDGDKLISDRSKFIYEGFGGLIVGKCNLKSTGEEIIFKSFYVANKLEGPSPKFWKEVALQTLASHPCCAKFLGCCVHDQTPEIQRSTLFLKYYRRGNLWSAVEESEEFIKKRKEIEKNPKLAKKKEIEEYCGQPLPNYFDARLFCNIAMDICNGIDFLHDKNIMHRDLKPANILIDEYFNAVVCDFGDSRVSVAGDERMMTKTGTGNWMSPEMLATLDMKNNEQLPSLTIALDIYSLGVIFWQIIEKVKMPYCKVEDPVTLSISQDMIHIILTMKYREPFSDAFEDEFPEIVNLIRSMWEGDPSKRPKIKKVLSVLYELEDPAFSELSERKNIPIRFCGKYEIIGDNSEWCVMDYKAKKPKMVKSTCRNEWKLIHKHLDSRSKISLAIALATSKSYWNRQFFLDILKKNEASVKKHRSPPPKYFEIVAGNTRERVGGDHFSPCLTKWKFFIKSREDAVNLPSASSAKALGDSGGSDNLKDKISKKKSSDRIKKASTPRDSPPHSSTHSLDASDKRDTSGPKRPTKGPNLDQAIAHTTSARNHAFKLDPAGSLSLFLSHC